MTFTNKAANEMKERLIKLGDEINAQDFTNEEAKTEEKKETKSDSGF